MREKPRIRGVYETPNKGSGIWAINYYDAEGRRHRETVGRFSLAVAAYHKRKEEIRTGKFFPPRASQSQRNFGALAEAALSEKRGRVAARSYLTDSIRLAQILDGPRAKWRNVPLAPLAGWAERVSTVLGEMRRQGLSGSTVNRYRTLVSSIFSHGMAIEWVPSNPVARVKRLKENPGRLRFLDEEEEISLRKIIRLDCPDREWELDLALSTGMRRSEQFGLKWDQVSLERGIVEANGKTGRRFIPINSDARGALLALHRISKGSAFVTPEARRTEQRDWRRWFEHSVKKADIGDFRWHDLRHTFASRLVMAGVDLKTVQELLGHKSVVMTQKYAHLSPAHKAEAVAKIATAKKLAIEGSDGQMKLLQMP